MKLFTAKISERATLQKNLTSVGNIAMLPANVDLSPPLQRGLMNVHLQNRPEEETASRTPVGSRVVNKVL